MIDSRTRPDLPALTSLRFFAAYYVVLFHGAQGLFHSALGKGFVRTGYVAVDFFFVLSGFVLTYRYCSNANDLVGRRSDFWVARFARVYPVYLLSVLLGAPLYVQAILGAHSGHKVLILLIGAAVVVLLLVQSWYFRLATAFNTPAWSLSVEAFLYFAFPFVMPRLARRFGTTRRAVLITTALWALATAAPLAYMAFNPDGLHVVDWRAEGAWLTTLRFMPIFHLPAFAIGIVAGRAFLSGDVRPGTWVTGCVGVATVGALLLAARMPYVLVHNGLYAPLFAMFIYCVAADRSGATAILRSRVLVAFGDASYAVYLLHFPLLQLLFRYLGRDLTWAEFAIFSTALLVLCLLIYRWMEQPMRRGIRARFRQMRVAAIP